MLALQPNLPKPPKNPRFRKRCIDLKPKYGKLKINLYYIEKTIFNSDEGRTALHTAIKEANKLVTDLLIARNADVKLADNKSRTALHWAAQLGRVEFIKTLLDGKVDAQALDSNGATPLHYAAAAGTTTSHCSTIDILLDHGVSVDIEDETGSTPLIWAASKGASNAIDAVF